MEHITRRRFVGWGLAGAAAALGGTWGAGSRLVAAEEGSARLRARPGKPTKRARKGRHALGLARDRHGVLSVPQSYKPESPVPLIVMLHGAGGRGEWYDRFSRVAAEEGIAMVMPDSQGRSWDLIQGGGFGPDIASLDRALTATFERLNVDPRRIAIAGFSDGASYALSVGLANGDLFSRVIAFSPGFMQPPGRVGKPRVFVSHGDQDRILPVSNPRDRIVPQLKREGYDVSYKEFAGGHTAEPDLIREACTWFLK